MSRARKYAENGNSGSIALAHYEAGLLSPESDSKYAAAKKFRLSDVTEEAHRKLLERVAAVYFGTSEFSEDETGRGYVRKGGVVLSIDWCSWKKSAPLEVRVYASPSDCGVDTYLLREAVNRELSKCNMSDETIKINWKASPAQVIGEIMTHFFSFETMKGLREQCIAELKAEADSVKERAEVVAKFYKSLGFQEDSTYQEIDSAEVGIGEQEDRTYRLSLNYLTPEQVRKVLGALR